MLAHVSRKNPQGRPKGERKSPGKPVAASLPRERLTPCQRLARYVAIPSQGTEPKDRYQPVLPNNKQGDDRLKLNTFKLLIRMGGGGSEVHKKNLEVSTFKLLDRRADFP